MLAAVMAATKDDEVVEEFLHLRRGWVMDVMGGSQALAGLLARGRGSTAVDARRRRWAEQRRRATASHGGPHVNAA